MLLAVVAVCWIARSSAREAAQSLAVAIAGVALWVAPVAAWNTAPADHFVLVSDSAGYNLRVGHAPYATGRYLSPLNLNADVLKGNPPSQQEAARRAVAYALTHPGRELELSAKKVYFLFLTDSDVVGLASTAGATPIWGSDVAGQRLADVADVFAYAVMILALASLPFTLSFRDARMVAWLTLAAWILVHIIFFGEPRYHLPILPIIIPMASKTLVQLVSAMTDGRLHRPAPSTTAR